MLYFPPSTPSTGSQIIFSCKGGKVFKVMLSPTPKRQISSSSPSLSPVMDFLQHSVGLILAMVQCSHINILVIPRVSPSLSVIYGYLQLWCCNHRCWEGMGWVVRGLSAPRRGCRADLESTFAFWGSQGQGPEFNITAANPAACRESCRASFPNLRKTIAVIYWVPSCNQCSSHSILCDPRQHFNSMRQVRKVKRQFNPIVQGHRTSNENRIGI